MTAAAFALAFLFVQMRDGVRGGDMRGGAERPGGDDSSAWSHVAGDGYGDKLKRRGEDEGSLAGLPAGELAGHRVLRKLPDVMVETRPIPNSDKYEVYFLRRSLEKAVVSGGYANVSVGGGQAVATPVELSNYVRRRRGY